MTRTPRRPSESPFFERPLDGDCAQGRLLLVSYHFPPAQTAGAMRWQQLSRYARARGFGLDVICADPDGLGMRDEASLEALPDGIRVFGVPVETPWLEHLENRLFAAYRKLRPARPEPAAPASAPERAASPPAPKPKTAGRVGSMAREEVYFDPTEPRSWIRAYWSYLDFARYGRWSRRAAALARTIVSRGSHRAVISCGPPHMAHVAALDVSRRQDLPLIMDLRDPWSLGERIPEAHASPLFFRLARHHERRTTRRAALIVMNTGPARDAMAERHPQKADALIAVPNACDDRPVPDAPRSERFRIAYAGTIYLDRTPRTLFRAVARLVAEQSLAPDQIAIEFMGHIDAVDDGTIDEIAAREGLAGFVETHPPGGFADAERFLANASCLVSLPQDSHMAIPSKIFDYMRFPARLLVFAEAHSATAQHLADSPADVVGPDDIEATLAVLRDAYRQHVDGVRPEPIARDPRYSRANAAERFFGALETVLRD